MCSIIVLQFNEDAFAWKRRLHQSPVVHHLCPLSQQRAQVFLCHLISRLDHSHLRPSGFLLRSDQVCLLEAKSVSLVMHWLSVLTFDLLLIVRIDALKESLLRLPFVESSPKAALLPVDQVFLQQISAPDLL